MLAETLLELSMLKVLQNNFCFQAFNMINKKAQSLEISKSYFFSITINFDLNDLKLLALFGNPSFLFFNINSTNDIDLEELYNS